MKIYLYTLLVLLSDGLVILKYYSPSENSYDMIRMIYLEKTLYEGSGLSPFMIFVMMGFTFNMILSVTYVTSNSIKSGSSFVLSRFGSSGRCLLYLLADTFKRIFFCALALSFIPAMTAILLWGVEVFADTMKLIGFYFIRQLLLLCFGAFTALILEKKLISTTADVLGTLLILLLVVTDIFSGISIVLVNVSANNLLCAGIELIVLAAAFSIYFICFGKNKEYID